MELDSNGVSIEQPIIQQDNYESYFRDEIEKYNLEDAIYSACDISEKRIKSLEEEIKNPRNFMTLCEVRQMLKAARKEEKIIDGMFKKTSLGRMVGLKPEEKKNKEKQKENNMHGH